LFCQPARRRTIFYFLLQAHAESLLPRAYGIGVSHPTGSAQIGRWRLGEGTEPFLRRCASGGRRCLTWQKARESSPKCLYEFLEAEGFKYAIRLPANQILQQRIGYLLKRPVGRPPNHVRRYYANFSYQAQSWKAARRVVAKVEWHPGELYPRVGFIITNLSRPAKRVVGFYNQRGTAEQWIKEGKNAIKWTRLSCCSFAANAVRLQLHALAYNLANFMRTLALPEAVKQWSLTSLREKLVKIGASSFSNASSQRRLASLSIELENSFSCSVSASARASA
jgi:hypothetical protein